MDIPGIRYRIIRHLPAYLLKFGSVDLEGFGRFRLQGHSAYIDHVSSLIYPPYYDVGFESGSYAGSSDYVNYLSKRLGLDDALISDVMGSFIDSIKHQIENFEPVTLEGMGIFLKTAESQVTFESDESNWGRSAIAELAVAFKPVPHMLEASQESSDITEQVPIVPISEVGTDKSEVSDVVADDDDGWDKDWDELIDENLDEDAIDSVEEEVTLDGSITSDKIVEHIDNQNFDASDEIAATDPIPVPIPVTDPERMEESTVAAQDNTRVAEPIAVVDVEIVNKKRHRWLLPLMFFLVLLIVPLSWYLLTKDKNSVASNDRPIEVPDQRLNQSPTIDKSETDPQTAQTPVTENEIDKEPVEDKAASETPASEEPTTPPVTKPETTAPDKPEPNPEARKPIDRPNTNRPIESATPVIGAGSCVIIVGAYGEGNNMRTMMNKLEAKGYKVYVDSARSLSRVGVYSACDQGDLNQNLSYLKQNIEPTSWILNN